MASGFAANIRATHNTVYEKVKDDFPAIQFSELIQQTMRVFNAKEDRAKVVMEVASELSQRYKEPIQKYLEAFGAQVVEDSLKNSKVSTLSELGNEEFSQEVVDVTKKVGGIIFACWRHDISEFEMITQLRTSGVTEIFMEITDHMGIDLSFANVSVETLKASSAAMISVIAFSKTYEILSSALADAQAAEEERILIENACAESIASIRTYRRALSDMVSDYLYSHAETFNEGFRAMDQAILDGDASGFVRGNVEIQKILNYNVQFSGQAEFDDLMNSEDAFIL